MIDRGLVGGVDLDRVVAASGQRPDLGVGPILDHRRCLGVAAEEVLADVGAVFRLEVLVLAVHTLVHELPKLALIILGEQRIPARAPETLDDVPAGAPEVGFQFLHDLAVAAHRPVEPLEVAVDDEDEVVELLAPGKRDCAERFRLVHLAVAAEHPDLARRGVGKPSPVQIAQKAGLVDRHQRAEAHRNGRELPEVRHQPGMGIGSQALSADLLAEVHQLIVGETALEIGSGVDARRAVALEIDQVAAMRLVRGMPEMHEPGVIEGRCGLEAGDVAAKLGGFLVRLDDHRRGVPADVAADVLLELAVAWMGRLVLGRNGVDVSGVGGERQLRALAASGGDHRVQNVVDLGDALEGLDGIERVEPFARFVGLVFDPVVHRADLPITYTKVVSEHRSLLMRPDNWQLRRMALQPCQSCMEGSALADPRPSR